MDQQILKLCSKCQQLKALSFFPKTTSPNTNIVAACKSCRGAYSKQYMAKNIEKRKKYIAGWNEANKETIKQYMRANYLKNREQTLAAQREHNKINRDDINARKRLRREKNKEKIRQQELASRKRNAEARRLTGKRYYESNKEMISKKTQGYYLSKREEIIKRNTKYSESRCKVDHVYALGRRARKRISDALRVHGYSKKSRTREMLGCDYPELVRHIESKFTDGMTWDNRHLWHIDHKIPLASAKTEQELLALCHYTNLQPLWALDNLKKGAKILPEFQKAA